MTGRQDTASGLAREDGEVVRVLWICRECGKVSSARRDPIRHVRWEHEQYEGRKLRCGPFDRFTATRDDRPLRPAGPEYGEVLDSWEDDGDPAPSLADLGLDREPVGAFHDDDMPIPF